MRTLGPEFWCLRNASSLSLRVCARATPNRLEMRAAALLTVALLFVAGTVATEDVAEKEHPNADGGSSIRGVKTAIKRVIEKVAAADATRRRVDRLFPAARAETAPGDYLEPFLDSALPAKEAAASAPLKEAEFISLSQWKMDQLADPEAKKWELLRDLFVQLEEATFAAHRAQIAFEAAMAEKDDFPIELR